MIFAVAGSKIYIGGPMPLRMEDLSANSFTGQVWTEIASVASIGSVGDSAQEIPIDVVGEGRTYIKKGTRKAASLSISCGLDYTDAGQLALVAAERSYENFAFRITFGDAPSSGFNPQPSQRLFCGLVMSAIETLDQANSVSMLTSTVAVNSNIVRIAADGGVDISGTLDFSDPSNSQYVPVFF